MVAHNWSTRIATVIEYNGQTHTLSGVNMVYLSSKTDTRIINTIYKFNVGRAIRGKTYEFRIGVLANSPDAAFIQTLLDSSDTFHMTLKPAWDNWELEQFGVGIERLEDCILTEATIAIEVEGDAPILAFRGNALRKTLINTDGDVVYTVGSGYPNYGSDTNPFSWLDNGG